MRIRLIGMKSWMGYCLRTEQQSKNQQNSLLSPIYEKTDEKSTKEKSPPPAKEQPPLPTKEELTKKSAPIDLPLHTAVFHHPSSLVTVGLTAIARSTVLADKLGSINKTSVIQVTLVQTRTHNTQGKRPSLISPK